MAYASPERRRAHEREYNQRPEVKAARAERWAQWYAKNTDRRLAQEAERRLNKRASVLVATVRTRAQKRGLGFDLDQHIPLIQSRIDKGVCELSGTAFDLSPGRKFNSPSVDRINPAKGYTYDNIRIVALLMNAALGDWGEEALRTVMTKWLQS